MAVHPRHSSRSSLWAPWERRAGGGGLHVRGRVATVHVLILIVPRPAATSRHQRSSRHGTSAGIVRPHRRWDVLAVALALTLSRTLPLVVRRGEPRRRVANHRSQWSSWPAPTSATRVPCLSTLSVYMYHHVYATSASHLPSACLNVVVFLVVVDFARHPIEFEVRNPAPPRRAQKLFRSWLETSDLSNQSAHHTITTLLLLS